MKVAIADKARLAAAYLERLPTQARVTLGTTAALALLVLLVVVSSLVEALADSSQRVSALEPRIARILGFEASSDSLLASLEEVRSQVARYSWDTSEDIADQGARLQQLTRNIAESAGLTVNGSQLLAPQEREWTYALRVNLELTGDSAALDEFLMELQLTEPLMLMESLRIVPARQRRGEESEELTISARVATFRLRDTL